MIAGSPQREVLQFHQCVSVVRVTERVKSLLNYERADSGMVF